MIELQELRKKIEAQDYLGALEIVNELEEMSVEDKINKIESYMVILLLHLIKQKAENRTTSSWNRYICNSTKAINKTNKRRKAGGFYLNNETLQNLLKENLEDAAYEAFEGKLSISELKSKFDSNAVLTDAFQLIKNG